MKIISILLSIILCIAMLTGCSQETTANTEGENKTEENKTTENTGANLRQNAAIGDNGRCFCMQGETQSNNRPAPRTSGHFVQRLTLSCQNGSCGYIPRRRITKSTGGAVCQGRDSAAACGGLPLTDGSGCAIHQGRGGGYILQSRPLFHDWKRAGDKVEPAN